jgi:hypothetical protein
LFDNFKSHPDYAQIVTSMDHRQAVNLAAIIRNNSKEGQFFALPAPHACA